MPRGPCNSTPLLFVPLHTYFYSIQKLVIISAHNRATFLLVYNRTKHTRLKVKQRYSFTSQSMAACAGRKTKHKKCHITATHPLFYSSELSSTYLSHISLSINLKIRSVKLHLGTIRGLLSWLKSQRREHGWGAACLLPSFPP